LIAIGVEVEYRFVARSLSRHGPKGEPDAPIAVESETADLVRMLKLIRRSNSSMLAIGVESEYRSVGRALSGWGPKGEPNVPITARSEVAGFLRWRCSCSCSSGLNMFFLRWWCVACRSLNVHRFYSGSSDLFRRFGPVDGPCRSPS
jgi:hypothetical protein